MCVGTMDGFGERGIGLDVATWPSASEDDLDIVREASMDGSVHEDHLDLPSPSVLHCFIVECTRLSRASWDEFGGGTS